MAWEVVTESCLKELVEFLAEREWGHVAFSSRLIVRGRPAFPSSRVCRILVNRAPTGGICEAILSTSTGLVIPVLARPASGDARSDIYPQIRPNLGDLHSIMGTRADVLALQSIVGRRPSALIDYHLMVFEGYDGSGFSLDGELGRRIVVKRAHPRDGGALFPLQKAYEIEEVLLDRHRFNTSVSYMLLQQSLRREIVFYARLDGRPVAKAGTNARGFGFAQLGGIYTMEELRNRGIASLLLQVLVAELLRQRKGICLFVKKDNSSAVGLYRKAGFAVRDEFRIAYYRQDNE